MPLSVTHATAADGTFSAAGVTNWGAEHTLTGIASSAQGGTGIAYFTAAGPTVARVYTFPDQAATILYSGGALGTPSSGTLTSCTGLPEAGLTLADNTTNNASATAHGFVPKWPNNTTTFFRGDGTYAVPAGGTTLDGITAATADQAGIANADWNVRWNWAKTTDSEDAFTIGESAAATGGTITSGIPNQNIIRLSTLAASTASPLRVDSRGLHVFSVSSTTRQILAASGTTSAPPYSFAADLNSGLFYTAGGAQVMVTSASTRIASFLLFTTPQLRISSGTSALTFINPQYSEDQVGTWGMSIDNTAIGFAVAGKENSRIFAGTFQYSYAAADTASYALNFRKSRGTVASPTVITTGDDLGTISGFGYVGATNTYQEACRITFDSTGTISDSATGIGGILRFLTAAVGAEPAEVLTLMAGASTGGGWAIMDEADGNPTTTELDANDSVAIYNKANTLVFAYNNAGTITYISIPMDGSTTAWTHSTVAP